MELVRKAKWCGERRVKEERERDERWGESFECCGGDGEIGATVCEGDRGDMQNGELVSQVTMVRMWGFGRGTVIARVFDGGKWGL